MPLPSPSDAEVRHLAEQILDRPEYGSWRSTESLVWVLEWIGRLWVERPILFWSLVATLTLLLVLIVVHVAWTIRVGLRKRLPAAAPERGPTALRFIEDAEALASGGHFLEAARVVQLGVIERLVRGGRLRLGRSDPNAVLRRRLADARLDEGLGSELVALLARLERSWFRDRREDRGLYEDWCRLHARLGAEGGAA